MKSVVLSVAGAGVVVYRLLFLLLLQAGHQSPLVAALAARGVHHNGTWGCHSD